MKPEPAQYFYISKKVIKLCAMSEKGKIAIPVDLRKDSEIAPGEKLMVLRRRDRSGTPLSN